MRTYSILVKDQRDLHPKERLVASVQASSSVEALIAGLKKVNWQNITVGTDISFRDDEHHVKTGLHGIVFSVHVGFDPLRDEEIETENDKHSK